MAFETVASFGNHGRDRPRGSHGDEVVFIVEEAPSVLDLGKRVVDQAGYRVLTAGNGEEAFKMAKTHHPQVSP